MYQMLGMKEGSSLGFSEVAKDVGGTVGSGSSVSKPSVGDAVVGVTVDGSLLGMADGVTLGVLVGVTLGIPVGFPVVTLGMEEGSSLGFSVVAKDVGGTVGSGSGV